MGIPMKYRRYSIMELLLKECRLPDGRLTAMVGLLRKAEIFLMKLINTLHVALSSNKEWWSVDPMMNPLLNLEAGRGTSKTSVLTSKMTAQDLNSPLPQIK